MGYFVDKKQFENKDFERTLEYYKSREIKMDDEIIAIYKANIDTAVGNYSNLHSLEQELESSQENIERHEENIHDAKERLHETKSELKKARKERWQAAIGSKEEATANDRVKQGKKHKKQAQKNLEQRKESYRKYLVRLENTRGEKRRLDEIQESCKAENEAIIAETLEQINFVTEFKTKLSLLEKIVINDVEFRVGSHVVTAGTVVSQLKKFEKDLKVSLATPLSSSSPEIVMLHLLEEHAIPQEHKKEYPEKLSEKQKQIEDGHKAYLERFKIYNRYLNLSSRGENEKPNLDDDNDGR